MSKWPSSLTLPEVQQSLREIWAKVEQSPPGNQDLKGHRFLNASDALAPREFITLGQADKRYRSLGPTGDQLFTSSTTSMVNPVRIGTYATRGAANLFRYTTFEASDRNYVAWVSDGASWIYAYGIHSRTQSQLAALAATLGASDVGYKVNVTDFAHVLQWTGSAWEWGPGEVQGGYFAFFPTAPAGNGWVLVDGTATSFLKADGTVTSVTPYDVSSMMLPYMRR